jgi:hypothetical protein
MKTWSDLLNSQFIIYAGNRGPGIDNGTLIAFREIGHGAALMVLMIEAQPCVSRMFCDIQPEANAQKKGTTTTSKRCGLLILNNREVLLPEKIAVLQNETQSRLCETHGFSYVQSGGVPELQVRVAGYSCSIVQAVKKSEWWLQATQDGLR